MKTLFISVVVFAMIGCASVKVAMMNQSFPPKSNDEHIQVFNTTRPEKPYIEIAELTANNSNNSWNINHLVAKAREIGADAVIIIGGVGSIASGGIAGNIGTSVSTDYGIKAIAIKYKDQN